MNRASSNDEDERHDTDSNTFSKYEVHYEKTNTGSINHKSKVIIKYNLNNHYRFIRLVRFRYQLMIR